MNDISIKQCVQALTQFEGVFAAAQHLRDIFEKAQTIEGETNRLKAEMETAVRRTVQAKQTLAQLEKQITDVRREIEYAAEQKSNMIEEGTERARESLKTVKAELDKARAMAAKQKKELTREITDLTANREQLKKEVATLAASKQDLAGSAQRIEGEAIRVSEKINQDRIALQREVDNLQNQKSQLGHEVKRLQVMLDEINRQKNAPGATVGVQEI